MKKQIAKIIRARKIRAKMQRESEIRSRIQVVGRNGIMWLVCDGTAIASFNDAGTTAKYISEQLERCRKTAVEFADL